MPIKTKLSNLQPARERLKAEIRLLSGGYSDRSLFPNGKVTVIPWDTEISEWFINLNQENPSGVTLTTELVAKLTSHKPKEVGKFLASEVTLLMLVSRSLITEHYLSYRSQCPHCRMHQAETRILVPDHLEKVGEKPDDYPGYDVITLPISGDEVHIRPLTLDDEKAIEDRSPAQSAAISVPRARVITSIVSVGGGTPTDAVEIDTYLRALNPQDVEFIQESIDELTPHVNTRLKHICDNPKCTRSFDHELSLDPNFFRPVRRR